MGTIMKNLQIVLTFFFLFCLTELPAAEKYFKVNGNVNYKIKKGIIYIKMFSEEEFEKKEDPKFVRVIKLDNDKSQKISFEFTDVPEGIYAIRCFQDLNGNRKIDMGLFGPKEPYGFYRIKGDIHKPPEFNDLSFIIDKNINNIKIRLR